MGWQVTEYGESHDGWTGAVLGDSSEPDPVYIDAGSGGGGLRTKEWWAYSGRLGRPRAAFFRGACSCGWRGPSYPIDWDQVDVLSDRDMDTDAAQSDWHGHIRDVDVQTVPLPESLTALVEQLHDQLHALAGGAPVAALKAVAEIELITRHAAREAAHTVQMDEEDGSGEAVGQVPRRGRETCPPARHPLPPAALIPMWRPAASAGLGQVAGTGIPGCAVRGRDHESGRCHNSVHTSANRHRRGRTDFGGAKLT